MTPGRKQSVIVTGGSGMIGSAIARRLAPMYDIIAIDKDEPKHRLPARAVFRQCDLTDDESVRSAVGFAADKARGPIASVLHLAAYYDFAGEPSDLYEQVTVRGTERLLRALKEVEVEQFVFSSTMLVHAPTERGKPISENSPLEARWAYPESKVRTEKLLREQHGGTPVVLLRIAGVYTDKCDSIPIAHQIQRILEHRLTGHVFPGDTSLGQAFAHLDDVVDAFARVVERRAQLPKETAILIGEPETYSYDRLQRRLAELIHDDPDWRTEEIPKAVAKGGAWVQDKIPGIEEPFIKPWMIDLADDHYELDVSRARDLLAWWPRRRLINTLPEMVASLRREPAAWYERHGLEAPSDLKELVGSRRD